MAVRNFYLSADIDGRETDLNGGPRAKDGGMCVQLYQRDEGGIEIAFRIRCIERDGMLISRVYDRVGNEVAEFVTKR